MNLSSPLLPHAFPRLSTLASPLFSCACWLQRAHGTRSPGLVSCAALKRCKFQIYELPVSSLSIFVEAVRWFYEAEEVSPNWRALRVRTIATEGSRTTWIEIQRLRISRVGRDVNLFILLSREEEHASVFIANESVGRARWKWIRGWKTLFLFPAVTRLARGSYWRTTVHGPLRSSFRCHKQSRWVPWPANRVGERLLGGGGRDRDAERARFEFHRGLLRLTGLPCHGYRWKFIDPSRSTSILTDYARNSWSHLALECCCPIKELRGSRLRFLDYVI